uniref:Ovule protein n=1 Tax=Panagrellus redivivus TaxID=6233 RepID=A0A7E4VPQ3_PANRE
MTVTSMRFYSFPNSSTLSCVLAEYLQRCRIHCLNYPMVSVVASVNWLLHVKPMNFNLLHLISLDYNLLSNVESLEMFTF